MLCGRSAESAPGGVERESKPSRDALFGLERETIEGCVAPAPRGGNREWREREWRGRGGGGLQRQRLSSRTHSSAALPGPRAGPGAVPRAGGEPAAHRPRMAMELWYVELIIEACECQMEQIGRFGYWRSQFLVPLHDAALRFRPCSMPCSRPRGVVALRVKTSVSAARSDFSINFPLQNFGIGHHTEQEVLSDCPRLPLV